MLAARLSRWAKALLGAALASALVPAHATEPPPAALAGRWSGEIRIPGGPLPLILDLERSAAGGWLGSVILPGRGVKGAAVRDLSVGTDGGARMTLGAMFAIPSEPLPALVLHLAAGGTLEGEYQMAGLAAPLTLRRDGPPQVDRPVESTPISDRLLGTWVGRFELGGYARQVTLTLGRTASEALVVGKRETRLVFDTIVEGRHFLTLASSAYGVSFEFHIGADTLDGAFLQGPFEAPISMRRQAAGERP